MNEEVLRDLVWNALGYAIVGGASLVVVLALYVFTGMPRLLPIDRLRPGAWGGYEVFLACCAFVGFPAFTSALLQAMGFFLPLLGDAPDFVNHRQESIDYSVRCGIIASPLSLALTLAVLFGFLFARTGTRPHHFGLTWARWRPNLVLGLAASVISTPILLALFALVKQVVPERPERIVESAQKFHEWEWPLFGFQVVIVAPILEEIIYRGILQNWLRRASLSGHLAILSVSLFATFLGMTNVSADGTAQFDWTPAVLAGALVGAYATLMLRLTRRFRLSDTEIQDWMPDTGPDDPQLREWHQVNASLAVFGSATLFALSHSTAWPAPVPLFLMALVLGELNRRTQSLLAPIVYHATFNLISFIALYSMTTHAQP